MRESDTSCECSGCASRVRPANFIIFISEYVTSSNAYCNAPCVSWISIPRLSNQSEEAGARDTKGAGSDPRSVCEQATQGSYKPPELHR